MKSACGCGVAAAMTVTADASIDRGKDHYPTFAECRLRRRPSMAGIGDFLKQIAGSIRPDALDASGTAVARSPPSSPAASMAHITLRFQVEHATLAAFYPVDANGGGRNSRSFVESRRTVPSGSRPWPSGTRPCEHKRRPSRPSQSSLGVAREIKARIGTSDLGRLYAYSIGLVRPLLRPSCRSSNGRFPPN